ncbi:putative efflux protein, MATE family [Halanaerobium congolense]|jgi:putative MATE family efflux protein|uniref:Probable multidrug resistance protein NorM n=1 Tax=Halanaerobium congolense TaxID=54121 RepID=A0A1G7GSC3_9FIRM|nr:MATE family efflux transporter [Halanaerobium congolense]KXS49873.1 MAG: MATE efflux family protein [Halanaerobium sp. T82-1]OEG63100.1 MAG: MATE family efflux transporter [Halanaerobium sp. MDAL1]PUU91195.1 MAG: MATE efflux family protein [Halanaerobium sp.]PTX16871.1 putative MATE family efflux protein [Halanaerobium congolense]PXV69966.1 putative MATE family efflux protein [Halanaerobium congolense]
MELKLTKNSYQRTKNIFLLALPAVLEMSLNTLVGMADTIMISRFIGKEALAAVGFANQIIFTLIFVFSAFNAGATAMVSRSYGEGNKQRMNKIMNENLTLNLILGIIVTIFTFFFANLILNIYDITEVVKTFGTTYLKYIAIGQLFMFISFAAAAGLRGAGDTKTPMYITGIANILNIIGNYILITGFWIFPELGIAGAAISTTFARFIAAALYLALFTSNKGILKLHPSWMKISSKIFKPLINLSYAAGIEQLFMQAAFFVNGIFISQLDTTAEASFRILLNIESLSFMPAIGIAIAATTLVGKHLGENNAEESLKSGLTAAVMGAIIGTTLALVYLIFPVFALKIFTTEIGVINYSVPILKIVALNQALLAFVIIMVGALRGAGDTKGAMYITIIRLWLIFIPLSYYLIVVSDYGVAGVWIAEIISFLIVALIVVRRFIKMEWAEIEFFVESEHN